jgi:hypothetical protein
MKTLLILALLSPLASYSQDMNVDLSTYCKDQLEKDVDGLNCDTVPPLDVEKKDDAGKKWKIRFHFGYSDTKYFKTDMRIRSSIINTDIDDLDIVQRTSNHHYNPANWDGIKTAFKWIDEPTNTFTLSLEKNKNNFYFTAFHPKYLKSVLYKETMIEGVPHYEFRDIEEKDDFSQTIPEGYNMLYLGNTHLNMVWQIGYGRQLTLFESKKAGKLTYIPKADIGISTGAARSVRIVPGVAWDDYTDDYKVQGYNASVGHRLEYQKGIVSMFVDQKVIFSKTKHGFYDGTAEYNLISTPLTFGIGIDLFSKKKKRN